MTLSSRNASVMSWYPSRTEATGVACAVMPGGIGHPSAINSTPAQSIALTTALLAVSQ